MTRLRTHLRAPDRLVTSTPGKRLYGLDPLSFSLPSCPFVSFVVKSLFPGATRPRCDHPDRASHSRSQASTMNGFICWEDLEPVSHCKQSGETMRNYCFGAVLLLCASLAAAQKMTTERLRVDATDAPRNILHSTITIPVTPGAVTLVYPKWIPGNHRPTGPIQNLLGFHMKANGQELEWQRDLVDMYAFHVQVPAGVNEVEASYDTVTYNGKNSAASSKV